MAYRGENIDIVLKGGETINLDAVDFKVLLYPDRHPEDAVTIAKSEMTKLNSNYYSGKLGYETTKTMILGYYTLEILIIEGSTSRSVFAKQGVFPLYDSASKTIS